MLSNAGNSARLPRLRAEPMRVDLPVRAVPSAQRENAGVMDNGTKLKRSEETTQVQRLECDCSWGGARTGETQSIQTIPESGTKAQVVIPQVGRG